MLYSIVSIPSSLHARQVIYLSDCLNQFCFCSSALLYPFSTAQVDHQLARLTSVFASIQASRLFCSMSLMPSLSLAVDVSFLFQNKGISLVKPGKLILCPTIQVISLSLSVTSLLFSNKQVHLLFDGLNPIFTLSLASPFFV
jgi:hypothetical protein